MAFRPERATVADFQGEGLLGVVLRDGSAHVYGAFEPTLTVPTIRAGIRDDRVRVWSTGRADRFVAPSLAAGIESWASEHAVPTLRSLGTGWCSWYCLWDKVTEPDIDAAITAIAKHELPIDVVQIDDGWQREIGDWTHVSPRFTSMRDVAQRITDAGHTPGIWTAPLCVPQSSSVVAKDWLVDGAVASTKHWGERIGVLDVTHPDAAEFLVSTFRTLFDWGYRYFKCDFLYAGAMEGWRHGDATAIGAYREALELIRSAIGDEAVLLGCGAPLLPSIGLVDAMRVSPDVDPKWDPPLDDISQPGMKSAIADETARRWMHGRFWLNDPDCLILRDEVADRERWARHVADSGGLVVSSDVLDQLDARGIELLRDGLRRSQPVPVAWTPRDVAQEVQR
jgi:alpha-galactosidase